MKSRDINSGNKANLLLSINSICKSGKIVTRLFLHVMALSLLLNPIAAQVSWGDGQKVQNDRRPSYSLHGTTLADFNIVDHSAQSSRLS